MLPKYIPVPEVHSEPSIASKESASPVHQAVVDTSSRETSPIPREVSPGPLGITRSDVQRLQSLAKEDVNDALEDMGKSPDAHSLPLSQDIYNNNHVKSSSHTQSDRDNSPDTTDMHTHKRVDFSDVLEVQDVDFAIGRRGSALSSKGRQNVQGMRRTVSMPDPVGDSMSHSCR